jgi:hypothetical protein
MIDRHESRLQSEYILKEIWTGFLCLLLMLGQIIISVLIVLVLIGLHLVSGLLAWGILAVVAVPYFATLWIATRGQSRSRKRGAS